MLGDDLQSNYNLAPSETSTKIRDVPYIKGYKNEWGALLSH
jgi:hypothetical protein